MGNFAARRRRRRRPRARSLVAVTPEGDELRMGPDDFGADKLGHA